MKKILILFFGYLLASCTANENRLTGKTFILSQPELGKTKSTILFQFSTDKEVEIITIKEMTKNVNSYTKTPYRIEGDMFNFQGVSYKMESNKDGFNLYKGEILKYRLIENKEDLGRVLSSNFILKKNK